MKKDSIKFTLYIPPDKNEKLEFLKYKKRQSKNIIILEALERYLPKQLKKYPEWKEVKDL